MAVVVLAVCLVSMDVLLALYDEADGSLEAGETLDGLFKDAIIWLDIKSIIWANKYIAIAFAREL